MTEPDKPPRATGASADTTSAPVGNKSLVLAIVAIVLGLIALNITTCSLLFVGTLAVVAVPSLVVGGLLGWWSWSLWKRSRGR